MNRFSFGIVSLSALLAGSAFSQPSGKYGGALWTVNENHTLIWNGKPYMPLGWRAECTGDALSAVTGTGIKDLLAEVSPDAWTSQIESLKSGGFSYLLTQKVSAPAAPGFVIRPEQYRLDGISKKGKIELPVPGAVAVYYFLVTEQGAAVSKRGWAPISDGKVSVIVEQAFISEKFRLFLYPKYSQTAHPDYWERFDAARDDLLSRAKGTDFGPGLRGFLNPLGAVQQWTWPNGGLVPDSELFRIEFQNYLETRYRDIDSLNRAWRLRSFELRDFERASRLVALFANGRGIDSLLDPLSDSLYAVDARNSAYWFDVRAAIDLAASRRTSRLASAIRKIADVPVVFEWTGWSSVFDTRTPSGDGVGMRTIESNRFNMDAAAGAASSTYAWRNRGWLIASEISPAVGAFADARSVQVAVLNCADLGAKGWYVRFNSTPAGFGLASLAADTSENSALFDSGKRCLFYPENAKFPAETIQLPGGIWWLPTPSAGNRIDVGASYEGYRHSAPYGTFFALWRIDAPKKVKLRFADPSRVSIKNFDGTEPEMKETKDGIELVIGTLPIIITGIEEQPVPEDAVQEAAATYKTLAAKAKSVGIDIGDSRFLFEDSQRRLQTSPGPAFGSMIDSLRKIEKAVGNYTWVEAEKPEESTFGFVSESAACSGGRYIGVETPYLHTDGSFYAAYSIRAKPAKDEYDLWVAARVPERMREFVQIEMRNRDPIKFSNAPVSRYGDGFAWYNLGRMKLNPGNYRVTVRVAAGAPEYDIALDVLLLAPPGFQPSGLKLPPAT